MALPLARLLQVTDGAGGGEGEGLRLPEPGDTLAVAGKLGPGRVDEGELGEEPAAAVLLEPHAVTSSRAPSTSERFMRSANLTARGPKRAPV